MKKKIFIIITILLIIITISIIYNTFPRLELNGMKNVTISYRDNYEEAGVIIKNANSNNLSKIKIENNIKENEVGNYYVDYTLKLGWKKLHLRRNVKIVDDINPVIKLKDSQIIEISLNKDYKEPGYTAYDEYEGDLTKKVEIEGEVNTNVYGEYILTYKVKDNFGNKTEVNRIIKVIDEIKPTIKCKYDYSAFKKGTETIIGCTAEDNFDGNITNKIEIEGNYDVNKPGIYQVTYKVKDEANNETKKNHTIIIYDEKKQPQAHLIFNETEPNKIEKILEILNEEKIKSTFFITKEITEDTKEYINKIQDSQEIGILDNTNQTLDEIKRNIQEIEKQLNIKITSYRLKNNKNEKDLKEIKKYLKDLNITYYDWDTNPLVNITNNMTKEKIIENTIIQILKNETQNIIISFNTDEISVETLPIIINILKDMNYNFDK